MKMRLIVEAFWCGIVDLVKNIWSGNGLVPNGTLSELLRRRFGSKHATLQNHYHDYIIVVEKGSVVLSAFSLWILDYFDVEDADALVPLRCQSINKSKRGTNCSQEQVWVDYCHVPKKSTPKPTCLSSFLTLHISGDVVLLKSIYWWIWLDMISVNICAENQVYIHDDFSEINN